MSQTEPCTLAKKYSSQCPSASAAPWITPSWRIGDVGMAVTWTHGQMSPLPGSHLVLSYHLQFQLRTGFYICKDFFYFMDNIAINLEKLLFSFTFKEEQRASLYPDLSQMKRSPRGLSGLMLFP